MKYLESTFSVLMPAGQEYADRWEATFGKAPSEVASYTPGGTVGGGQAKAPGGGGSYQEPLASDLAGLARREYGAIPDAPDDQPDQLDDIPPPSPPVKEKEPERRPLVWDSPSGARR